MIKNTNEKWEVIILDADVNALHLQGFDVADIDGDGLPEFVSGGDNLVWHKPDTHESGVIAENLRFHV